MGRSSTESPSMTSTSYSVMVRSEEHTSELQSPCNLVCRLLLEKKKQILTYVERSMNANNGPPSVVWFPRHHALAARRPRGCWRPPALHPSLATLPTSSSLSGSL